MEEDTFSNSFSETRLTVIPRPDKDSTNEGNYKPESHLNLDAEILHKVLAN